MTVDSAAQSHVREAQHTGEQILQDLDAAVAAQAEPHQDFLRLIEEVKDMNTTEMRKHVDVYLAQHQELERKAGVAA